MTATAPPLPRSGGHPPLLPLARRALARLLGNRFALAVLAVETILLTIAEILHRPWFDEAQAWLLARDTGPLDLLVHHLRYEGSPGLWHLLLMVPSKLGLPYRSMAVIAVAATLTGSAVLLLRSPLPRWLSALLCFSFFPLFQYGVIARSYCLLAPLLFLIATTWNRRRAHPTRLVVLLSLLANVSFHGFLIAGSLALLHLAEVRSWWPSLTAAERRAQRRGTAVVAAVLLSVLLEVVPPADLIGGGSWHVSPPWDIFRSSLVTRQLGIVALTVAALAVSIWWFRQRRCLALFLLPSGALLLLFMFRYFSPWHAGTVFLVWAFALWISFEKGEPDRFPRPGARSLVLAVVSAGLAGQVAWSAMSLGYDWTHSYSASADIAAYLTDHHLDGERIDLIGKWGVGILPYFDQDIFHNYNGGAGPAYFPWNSHVALYSRPSDILLDEPDVVLIAVKSREGASPLPCLPGYRRERDFPGGVYWPGGVMETESFALYRRSAAEGERWFWGNCGVL